MPIKLNQKGLKKVLEFLETRVPGINKLIIKGDRIIVDDKICLVAIVEEITIPGGKLEPDKMQQTVADLQKSNKEFAKKMIGDRPDQKLVKPPTEDPAWLREKQALNKRLSELEKKLAEIELQRNLEGKKVEDNLPKQVHTMEKQIKHLDKGDLDLSVAMRDIAGSLK